MRSLLLCVALILSLTGMRWAFVPSTSSPLSNAGSFGPDGQNPDDELVYIADDASLYDSADVVWLFWIKGAAQDTKAIVDQFGAGGSNSYYFRTGAGAQTDHLYIYFCNNSTGCGGSDNKILETRDVDVFDDAYHLIIIKWDAGVISVCIDNAASSPTVLQNGSFTTLYNSTANTYLGTFGGFQDSGYNFDGNIDEFAMFVGANADAITCAGDASTLYNSGTPIDLTSYNPAVWLRFESDSAHTGTDAVVDASGNANHGTPENLEDGDENEAIVP